MTGPAQRVDALLETWKRQMLPDRFPDLEEWLSRRGRMGPAYWKVMDRIWRGTAWDRHVDASRTLEVLKLG